MGWIISVGRAGAKGRTDNAQALALRVDMQGVAAQVRVYPDAGRTVAGSDHVLPAWQAQRVWQNVLTTLVGN